MSIEDGYINTIEGNSSNECKQKRYSLESSVIFVMVLIKILISRLLFFDADD